MRSTVPVLVCSFLLPASSAYAQPSSAKADARVRVERQGADLVGLSDRVWELAETALREDRSAAVLADHAEQQGFTLERGVAGMPTAFVASYGQGRPVIAIMAEYDALPGLSQTASTTKEPFAA